MLAGAAADGTWGKALGALVFFVLAAGFLIAQIRSAGGARGAASSLYRPPAPAPMGPTASLLRMIGRGDRNLLDLLPAKAYRAGMTELGASRRGILVVNDPDLVGMILADPGGIFPKNDLMVSALEGLVGDSMFVTSGANWRRQRRMIDPAFSLMRINRAFPAMEAAIAVEEARLDALAAAGSAFSLDAAMSGLTADIICRTIFSKSLESATAREVFVAFAAFERSVASVEIGRLLWGRPFDKVPQPERVLAACRTIRRHVGDLIDERVAHGFEAADDIAKAVIEAVDPETGARFSREELIDQIGVFFLAGHETTASALTWAFFMLARQPAVVARMRAEIGALAGEDALTLDHVKRLSLCRNVFREALRLYPPITFIPRVALADATIGGRRVQRGTMIMIAPWALHRHEIHWRAPDRFDPDRFAPEREGELTPGAYLPFGLGPRICVGAGFATVEATLILARIVRRFDIEALAPDAVRPVARLTTRPAEEIMCRVRRLP